MSAPQQDPNPPAPPGNVTNAPGRKVTFATVGAYLGGVAVLAIVAGIQKNIDVISADLPAWANVIITPLVPAAVTFITGWVTRHAPQDLRLPVKRTRVITRR